MGQQQEAVSAALVEALSNHAGTAVSTPEAERIAATVRAATSIVRRIAVPLSTVPASVFRVAPNK